MNIDQVHQLTGLPAATLRNWEKRYGFPRPQRSAGGHRVYSPDEVRKIQMVSQFCRTGTRPQEAIQKVLDESLPAIAIVENVIPPQSTLDESVQQVLGGLYRYDADFAEEALSRVGMRLSEKDILEFFYPRLLHQIGEDWEKGRINIAQEHFGWGFLRSRLLSYFKQFRSASQPKALLATPSGEHHEGGLIILAATMMLKGWNIYYLGTDLPFEDLSHAAQVIDPHLVCLSANQAACVIPGLQKMSELSMPVVIGGAAVGDLQRAVPVFPENVLLMRGSLRQSVAEMDFIYQSQLNHLRAGAG